MGTDPRALSAIWRSFYFIGGIIVFMFMLYRFLILEEGEVFQRMLDYVKERDRHVGKVTKFQVVRFYLFRLLGTGGNWLLMDIAFYGTVRAYVFSQPMRYPRCCLFLIFAILFPTLIVHRNCSARPSSTRLILKVSSFPTTVTCWSTTCVGWSDTTVAQPSLTIRRSAARNYSCFPLLPTLSSLFRVLRASIRCPQAFSCSCSFSPISS